MKDYKSVKEVYSQLAEGEVIVDKLNDVKDLARAILDQDNLSACVGIIATIQELLHKQEETYADRLERFRKAKIGQILNSMRLGTEYGQLLIKRHKINADALGLSIQLKRDNGMLVTLETHDELQYSFEAACQKIKQFAEEGTLGDYVIQAYESVVSL